LFGVFCVAARKVLQEANYEVEGQKLKVFEKTVPSVYEDRFIMMVSSEKFLWI